MPPEHQPPPEDNSPDPAQGSFPRLPPHADLLFVQDLQRRRVPFTYIFMGLNFVIFIAMSISGGTTSPSTLLAFGAKSNVAIDAGEVWRFLTPVFIHIGILHLAFNSYALWIVGQQVERLYGSARFVTLYVLMGIAGVAGSYAFSPDSISAGASGAIFGLFGVLLMFSIRNRRRVPAFLRRAIGAGILPVILLNLGIGFAIPAIDNAAHVGGLLAGVGLASVIGFREPGYRTGRISRWAQVAALGMILAGFQQVAVHYEGPRATNRFIDAINQAERSFSSARRAVRLESGDWGARVEDLGTAIDSLRAAPSLSAASGEIIQDLERALGDQHLLIEDVRRTGEVRDRHRRQLEQNSDAFGQTFESLFEWVDREGDHYGVQLGERQRN